MATQASSDDELPGVLDTYAQRLAYAIAQLKHLKPSRRVPALAEAIEMTAAGIYIVLNDKEGTRTLTAVNNARAAQFCKVDPTWLALGEGLPRPRPLSTEALDVAELYDSLSAEDQKKFWMLLQVVRPPNPAPAAPPGAGIRSSKARV